MVGKTGRRAVVWGVVVPAEQAAVFRSRIPPSPYSLQVGRGDVFRVGVHAAKVAERDKCGDDEQDDRANNDKALGKGQYESICIHRQV